MNRAFTALVGAGQRTFADTLLLRLVVGVILAALFFKFVLGADSGITIGMLVIGCVTAYLEASSHRNRKG
jgi:hypothetical protein